MNWLDNIDIDQIEEDLMAIEIPDEETDWRIERLGNITGSIFGKFVKQSRDKKGYELGKGKVAENLIYKIAWERLLKEGNISDGLGRLNINSMAIEHGTVYEGHASVKYTERTGREIISEQKYYSKNEWIGGTPDGFVGEDGLIEIKCPWNGGNHLHTLITEKIYNPEFVYQIQGYLWITGRKWCDFVTYDPDLIDELQLSITRIPRDEQIIEGIQLVLEQVKEKIELIISKINKNGENS